MKVDVAIHLFGLPEVEFNEYDLTGEGVRGVAANLRRHLNAVADAVEKLRGDGWVLKIVRNNLEARHPQVRTYAEAVERLRRLHIDDAVTDVAEWNDLGERLTPP